MSAAHLNVNDILSENWSGKRKPSHVNHAKPDDSNAKSGENDQNDEEKGYSF